MGYHENSLEYIAGVLEEKMSKMGTEELVTVLVGFLATSNRNLILIGLEYFE